MTIDVTQEDIDVGRPGSRCNCPIARAVGRALDQRSFIENYDCQVSYTRVFVNGDSLCLPIEARNFIKMFDTHRPVTPFSFELEL